MKLLALILVSLIMILPLQACKWKDDFRDRRQPYYLEYNPEATFNVDSEQYVGDDVAREIQGEVIGPDQFIPEIDDRADLPYIPEHPAGVVEYESVEVYE